jgi:hypothetical protein
MQASNSLLPLEIDQAVDPRINLLKKRYYTILRSAQNNMQIPLPSSGTNDSSLSWTSPFTPSNILDKRMTVSVAFSYAATTAAPYTGPILNIGTYDCPAMMPFQNCVQQITSSLNTTSFTLPTNDILTGIMCLRTRPQYRDKMLSTTPVWPDQYQEFSDGALTNRSPMGSYGDNPAETLRGGWPQISTLTNTTTSATWIGRYHDLILLPPYETGSDEGPGFAGVTTNSWQMNLGTLTDSWNHMDPLGSSGSPVWNTFTASIVSSGFQPTLNYNILTPHLIPALPADVYYPLTVIDRLSTAATAVAAWSGVGGASSSDFPGSTVTSNMVNLSYVPSMVMIYVRESNSQLSSGGLGYTRSKAFAGISSVSITFNSLTGILNNATHHQLYQFGLESGLEMSWPQFYKYRGAVLPLMFGRHIPLVNPDLAPGVRGNFNFQVKVSYYNTNTKRGLVAPQLYVLPYYEGTLIGKPGVFVQQQGVISHQNVLESMSTPPVNAYVNDEITGGSMFSFIRSAISKIAPIAEKIFPVVKALAPVLGPLVGLGLNDGSRSMPQIIHESEDVKDEVRRRYAKLGKSNLVGRLVPNKR